MFLGVNSIHPSFDVHFRAKKFLSSLRRGRWFFTPTPIFTSIWARGCHVVFEVDFFRSNNNNSGIFSFSKKYVIVRSRLRVGYVLQTATKK